MLDDFVPAWDVRQFHRIEVEAPPERAFEAVRRLDLGRSRLNRLLFRARGLPVARFIRLSDLLARGFVLLAEDPPRELILGLVARPWTLMGGIRRMDAEGFRRFHRPGYARIGWSFSVEPAGRGRSRVTTETRVRCTDGRSRRRFRWYWRVIGPFSGVIRREALALIKADAERAPGNPRLRSSRT
jgi:hypothetical protein